MMKSPPLLSSCFALGLTSLAANLMGGCSGPCTPDEQSPTKGGQCCSGTADSSNICCSGSRCAAAPVSTADLAVTSFSIQPFVPSVGTGTLYLCINQDASGTPKSSGDHIDIKNVGAKAAGAYDVELAIINVLDLRQIFSCPQRLHESGTAAGATTHETNPWCCSFSIEAVPTGTYKLYIDADPDHNIEVAHRDNNFSLSAGTLAIP